jgi:hypothetical protein
MVWYYHILIDSSQVASVLGSIGRNSQMEQGSDQCKCLLCREGGERCAWFSVIATGRPVVHLWEQQDDCSVTKAVKTTRRLIYCSIELCLARTLNLISCILYLKQKLLLRTF